MKTWGLIALLVLGTAANANSFVGNGGGQGDVELLVTLKQMQESYQVFAKKAEQNIPLCQCNSTYNGRSICEPLKALSETQAGFCNASLYKVTPQLQELLRHRETIHFNWTNESIEVNEKGQYRLVDAVTNRDKREITINQPRFLAMSPAERVFLLSHELMHLTQLDGKPLEDRGAVGPFAGEDGARDLVNSMAAAAGVAQGAFPKEVKSYGAKLHRSQAWKPVWFTLEAGSATPQTSYNDNFYFTNYQRYQATARYQFGNNWGAFLEYRREIGDTSISSVNIHEDVDVFGLGLAYRIFPFSDPLTFMGQSHVLTHAAVEMVRGTYKESELDTFSDDRTGVGASLGASYYFPIFVGFWAYVDVTYEYRPLKYTINTNPSDTINFDKNLISGNIGVSYAF